MCAQQTDAFFILALDRFAQLQVQMSNSLLARQPLVRHQFEIGFRRFPANEFVQATIADQLIDGLQLVADHDGDDARQDCGDAIAEQIERKAARQHQRLVNRRPGFLRFEFRQKIEREKVRFSLGQITRPRRGSRPPNLFDQPRHDRLATLAGRVYGLVR